MGTRDDQATGNGVIVCKDGSPATTVNAAGFSSLAGVVGLAPSVFEVECASLFCEVTVS
jgi:hypothetical protein